MDGDYTVAGFQLSHLVVLFILLGCALFTIYWLWMYPCKNNNSSHNAERTPLTSSSGRSAAGVTSRADMTSSSVTSSGRGGRVGGEAVLYAMEIEPGTVVLQSPHSDLFRVLREYDSITQNGTPTSSSNHSTLTPGACYPVHYIPAYTRPHVQNHVTSASAPPALLHPGIAGDRERPLEETPSSGDTREWRPLSVQSADNY